MEEFNGLGIVSVCTPVLELMLRVTADRKLQNSNVLHRIVGTGNEGGFEKSENQSNEGRVSALFDWRTHQLEE
jgi:hypothetical protein